MMNTYEAKEDSPYGSILNFRRPTKTLKLYRYAALDHASQDDVNQMLFDRDIVTRVDLRSPLEKWRSEVHGPLKKGVANGLLKVARPFGATAIVQEELKTRNVPPDTQMTLAASVASQVRAVDALWPHKPSHDETIVTIDTETVSMPSTGPGGTSLFGSAGGQRTVRVIHINFLGASFVNGAVWDRASHRDRFRAFWYIVTIRVEHVVTFVGERMLSSGGLLGSYQDFILHSQEAMGAALKAVIEGLESGRGVGVSCQFGKDRTGLVIALTLCILGDSRHEIATDYALSETGLKLWLPEMKIAFTRQGLTHEFATSPYQVMTAALNFIDTTYDSIEAYLDLIGIHEEWRKRLLDCVNQ